MTTVLQPDRPGLAERLVARLSGRPARGTSRRGFLGGAALVGAAVAVNPWGYLVRPASAYDAVCGSEPNCNDGYSVFCCTINDGANTCPPDSFIGGWWKADNSSFCGGAARYYIDCNAYRDGHWECHCAEGTCDSRRVACNQFRYGQCSLDVPYSNTGPVVCRMVSCTPPWEQHAGLCTSSSATDNSTATHTAPCNNGTSPIGSLDKVVVGLQSVRVGGWAVDRDQPGTAITIAVLIDGVQIGRFATASARPDVNRAYGVTGNHGFDRTLTVRPGRHTLSVRAVNVGGGAGDSVLGSRTITVNAPKVPVGHVDAITPGANGQIRITGWAFDPDLPTTSVKVIIYRDGHTAATVTTAAVRSDVNKIYGITGKHGFTAYISASPGKHTIQVKAVNIGGASGNPIFGSGTPTVVGYPMGSLDSVVAVSGGVRIRGWAFDPDDASAATKVEVVRDGTTLGSYPTGKSRPDVNRIFHNTGNHGFDLTIPTGSGKHSFIVRAVNVGPAAPNTTLGTRTVQL